MQQKSSLKRLYIVVGLLSWLGLTTLDSPTFFNSFVEVSNFWASFTKNTFLGTLTLSILFFYKLQIDKNDSNSFNDLFWKLSVTGFVIVVLLTGHSIVSIYLPKIWPNLNEGVDSIIEQGLIAITLVFIVSCLYVFKRLILYQKTKEVITLWKLFEYMIYLSPIINYFNFEHNDVVFQLIILPYLLLSFILCTNFKWIAYLNIKQKWNNIIYLCVILFLTLVLAWNIINISQERNQITDLTNSIIITTLFIFIAVYCILAILVLLFNLPTSSVFEKKFGEVMNFQKLSKSTQVGKTEDEVYQLLIDSSITTLMAGGAVLEVLNENGLTKHLIYRSFDEERFSEIKSFINTNNIEYEKESYLEDELSTLKQFDEISYMGFASMLILPLRSHNEKFGNLFIFSEIKQGFEKEMIEIVNTYVSQACTSISNLRLIQQAVSQARYMRDREIAKRVQTGLLPNQTIDNEHFKMSAISISADDVGGDYYDYTALENNRYIIVIGDVSGKGTSAAFHMAKLKGVFHSLALLDLPSDTFMKHANAALSACLDKATFVTLSILVLDFEKRILTTCRAGHCPTLYYHANTQDAEFLQQSGLGLGIIRNHPYSIDFDTLEVPLGKNDLILLYTDGIAEASNTKGEEFGYERLSTFVKSNFKDEIDTMKLNLMKNVQEYCENKIISDDYTAVLIKIK